jgi:hypothetical protein
VQRIVGKPTHRKGRGVSSADNDSASALEVGDDWGIARGDHVTEGDDTVVGRAAGLVGVDLGGNRHAVQLGERLAPRLRLIGSRRGGQRFLFQDAHHCVDRRIHRVQTRQARLGRFAARGAAEPDQSRHLGRVQPPEIVGHRDDVPRASSIARHTRSGVAGMSM